MSKILTIFISIISWSLMAQVPQGVGYQGVATDANGIELVNQSISIKSSVLSGSANGTVEWEETHATSTDTFGLFALTIGQGTSTGNGAQLSFADISWGTNTHYLKIEIDVTGGANYSFMGSNQMMSVPYALYAESANINYDSISNFLSGDSTFITNVGGGMGGGGCNFNYPDGLNGEVINLRFSLQGSYTVPSGKTLYVTNFFGDDPSCYLSIDFNNINGVPQIINGVSNYRGIQGNNVPGLLLPIIVGEGETLSGGGGNASCNGLLVDKGVTPITWQLGWGSYTVPVGKKLYILNSNDNGSGQSSYFYIDDGNGNQTIQNGPTNSTETNSFGIPLILGENTILSGNPTFNGYLVDENYFAGCGGGGSSGNSNSNTSGPNQTLGLGSVTDLNDFDKEYDMFNAQFSGGFDNNSYDPINIHTDQLKNIYIVGKYNCGDNNTIGGISLYSGSGSTFFIAKYDSTGVLLSVISEPVGTPGIPESYHLESSMVDNFGNIFVGGRLRNSWLEDDAFIRKYSTTNLTFVDEEISSSNPGYYDNQVYDIVSDGSGGVYLAGSYKTNITTGGIYLAADNTNSEQGFVFHWNSSGNVPWANSIGDLNGSNLDDYASSIIVDQNNDILVAGNLRVDIGAGINRSKHFIKRYDSGGTLMTTVESTEFSNNWYQTWGVKINTDNNGNIYLFTACDDLYNYAFNSYPLDVMLSTSKFLYKMDINFSVLSAINFGTENRRVRQIITLSNNDVILRSLDQSQFIINNNVYLQDIDQQGNIIHLDSNNSFIKFHTIGNNIGTQDAISITSDANTIYSLYKRKGTFINNGTNHPTGYYVVKESY